LLIIYVSDYLFLSNGLVSMILRKATQVILAALALCLIIPAGASAYTPNDEYFSQQWAFSAIGLESAWDYNQGGSSNVKVAVIDSGVDHNIADFSSTNFDLANAWDYVGDDSNPWDETGHGTHVAGTIAQSTNNGIGAAGIAYNTTILPIRVLNENGVGSFDDVTEAIYRAVNADADIINLSLGAYFGTDALRSACEYAEDHGVLVVAAAGNKGTIYPLPNDPGYYDSTLVVGSVDQSLNHSDFSQSVIDQSGYGLVAPGEDILQVINESGGTWMTGTSMATPIVSGVAALILSEALDLGLSIPGEDESRVDWLRGILFDTALDLGEAGDDRTYGNGLVKADAALAYLNSLVEPDPVEETPSNDDGGNSDTDDDNEQTPVVYRPNNRDNDDGR
jgi:subtilisin family serine protease